jgi:hypothetical protein
MAAAVTLQLAAACEELGLVSEAAAWLEAAAPESWPSAQQQQAAAQLAALQQLASQVVTAAAGNPAGAAQDSMSRDMPQHAAFLVAAVQQADPTAVQAWVESSCSTSPGSRSAAAVRCSSSRGTWRPASASKMQLQGLPSGAAAITSAGGEESTLGSKAHWLRPLSQQECLLGVARYLVDHAQYTPAVRLCATALQLARCGSKVERRLIAEAHTWMQHSPSPEQVTGCEHGTFSIKC